MLDFHTHNLLAPMPAIINMPRSWLLHPEQACLRPEATYSVGVHPWWTNDSELKQLMQGLNAWAAHPQVVAIGECGFDRLQGAEVEMQRAVFETHVQLSEQLSKPLTIHCVRAFDELLAVKKQLRPQQQWTIHGFRGKAPLAQQLLKGGMHLSFGAVHNHEAYAITPPEQRHHETDETTTLWTAEQGRFESING